MVDEQRTTQTGATPEAPESPEASRASAPATGATQAGTPETVGANLDDHGRRVRGIFSNIATRYEAFNALSSMGIYRYWLRVMARMAACKPTDLVLDVAGGAGDVSFELCRVCPPAAIELTDFCPEMLDVARRRIAAGESRGVPVTCDVADAMALPFPDEGFDVLTVAYGLRNFSDRVASMREALRVLRPGGTYVALEFSTPANPAWRALYGWYRDHMLPLIGGAVTCDRAGFDYLARSIREFPSQDVICEELRGVGFADVGYHDCTGGIATVYRAVRPRA